MAAWPSIYLCILHCIQPAAFKDAKIVYKKPYILTFLAIKIMGYVHAMEKHPQGDIPWYNPFVIVWIP